MQQLISVQAISADRSHFAGKLVKRFRRANVDQNATMQAQRKNEMAHVAPKRVIFEDVALLIQQRASNLRTTSGQVQSLVQHLASAAAKRARSSAKAVHRRFQKAFAQVRKPARTQQSFSDELAAAGRFFQDDVVQARSRFQAKR